MEDRAGTQIKNVMYFQQNNSVKVIANKTQKGIGGEDPKHREPPFPPLTVLVKRYFWCKLFSSSSMHMTVIESYFYIMQRFTIYVTFI